MNRKKFMQNLLFCFGASLTPKILESKSPFVLKKGGETMLGLTEDEIVELKLRKAIIVQSPSGKVIDMKYIREAYEELKKMGINADGNKLLRKAILEPHIRYLSIN